MAPLCAACYGTCVLWVWIVAGLVLLIAVPIAIGAALPREHVASVVQVHGAEPVAVWQALTDYERMPQWRPGLRRVELLETPDGRRRVREHSKFGPLTYDVELEEPPRRLVGRIVDEGQGFGGTWTYELAPVPGGTELRITERGEIHRPLFRFLARFVFGHEGTIRAFQQALARRLTPPPPAQ